MKIGIDAQRVFEGAARFVRFSCRLQRTAQAVLCARRVRIIASVRLEQFDGSGEIRHLGHLIPDKFDAAARIHVRVVRAEQAVSVHDRHHVFALRIELLEQTLSGVRS